MSIPIRQGWGYDRRREVTRNGRLRRPPAVSLHRPRRRPPTTTDARLCPLSSSPPSCIHLQDPFLAYPLSTSASLYLLSPIYPTPSASSSLMPPNRKRNNAQARKRIESPAMYSHSPSDTPSSSAASSPPEGISAFDRHPPFFDTGPLLQRAPMTRDELEPDPVVYGGDLLHTGDDLPLGTHDATVRVPRTKPAPIQTLPVYQSPSEGEVEDQREYGHVRSPMLAR